MAVGIITNKEVMPERWKWLNIIDYLLPIYILCTIPIFYYNLHYDFIFKGVSVLVTVCYLMRFKTPRDSTTVIFNLFIIVVSLSFLQYLYNNRPITCYFIDASNYITAMLFYYIGVTDERPGRPFYKKLLIVLVFIFVAGLVCYLLTPSWYIERNLERINASSGIEYNEVNVLDTMRFNAFFGDSYSISHFSVFCCAISVFCFAYSRGKQKVLALIFFVIGLLASVASMHRASMLGCLITVLMYVYFNHRSHYYKKNIAIIIGIIIVIALFIIFSSGFTERLENIFGMVTNRVDDNMNLNKALSERKYTKELLQSMEFFIFGHGLGAGSVSVREYGFPGVSDMQYVKMFYENGLVGAFLFLIIMARTIKLGFKYIEFYLTEISMILFILLAMFGSNSLSIYYFIVFPFWYAVGRINNNEYLKKLKNKEWI